MIKRKRKEPRRTPEIEQKKRVRQSQTKRDRKAPPITLPPAPWEKAEK